MIAFRPRTRLPALPDDGSWVAASAPWAVVLEDVMRALPRGLTGSVSLLPDHRAVELRTRPHATVAGAIGELGSLRAPDGGLASRPGETAQRARACLRPGEPSGGRRLRRLTGELSAAFVDA